MSYVTLSEKEETIGKAIVNAAFQVHKELGPGLLEKVNPVWQAQIISHLKLANKNLGYLINFNVPLIKQGIKRFRN